MVEQMPMLPVRSRFNRRKQTVQLIIWKIAPCIHTHRSRTKEATQDHSQIWAKSIKPIHLIKAIHKGKTGTNHRRICHKISRILNRRIIRKCKCWRKSWKTRRSSKERGLKIIRIKIQKDHVRSRWRYRIFRSTQMRFIQESQELWVDSKIKKHRLKTTTESRRDRFLHTRDGKWCHDK